MDNIYVIICYGGQWDDSWEHPVRYALSIEEAQVWIDKQVIIDAEQDVIDGKIAERYQEWYDTQEPLEYTPGDDDAFQQLWEEHESLWMRVFHEFCLVNNIDPTKYDEHTNKGNCYPEECWYKVSEPIKHVLNS